MKIQEKKCHVNCQKLYDLFANSYYPRENGVYTDFRKAENNYELH